MSPSPGGRALLDAITHGGLSADGALGSLLLARGFPPESACEALAISRPEVIAGVHEEYLRAGAELIETDSFGANRYRLAALHLGAGVRELNLAAAGLARRAAGSRAFVAGAMGPTGLPPEALAREDRRRVVEAFQEQAEALAEGGVDALLLETMRGAEEISLAVEGAQRAVGGALPVFAQVSTDAALPVMPDGTALAAMGERLRALGCDLVGVNCCSGPEATLAAVEALLPLGLPVSAFPSAGLPRRIGDALVYPTTPEVFGALAGRLRALGVSLVGGCCGTTPAHIERLRAGAR